MTTKVGIKICGNCNPLLDCREFVESLKNSAAEGMVFTHKREDADVILIVSGCPVDCTGRPDTEKPTVVVAGNTINHSACSEEELVARVISVLEGI